MNNADFPAMPYTFDIGGGFRKVSPGLTKREYFAGLAMQGLIAHGYGLIQGPELAVEYADALLKELEQTGQSS